MLVGIGVVPFPWGADCLCAVEAVDRLFVDYLLKSHHQLINIENHYYSSTTINFIYLLSTGKVLNKKKYIKEPS